MVKLDDVPKVKLVDEGGPIDEIFESCHLDGLLHHNRRGGPGNESRCCAFSHDEKFFAWSVGHGFVKVIYSNDSRERQIAAEDTTTCGAHYRNVWNCELKIDCAINVLVMQFGPPGYDTNDNIKHLLATGLENGRIKIWNPITGDMIYNLSDHASDVTGLSFAHRGEHLLISSSKDGTLKVWDLLDDGNMTLTMTSHRWSIFDCAISPADNTMICSVGQGQSVVIWKLYHKRSYSIHSHLKGHMNDVVSCSWSPDGALVATASHDATVAVWDPISGQRVLILGHKNPLPEQIFAGGANGSWVNSVDFSSDGSHLATICEDNKLRIWRLWKNSPPLTGTLAQPAYGCKFSPSRSVVAFGNSDGSASLFDIGAPTMMSLSHLSRMAVRRSLNTTDVNSLNLPPLIQKFLLYKVF